MSILEISSSIQKYFPEYQELLLETFDLDLISDYIEFLKDKNEQGGFFSKRDAEHILERHIIEAMYFVYVLSGNDLVSRETKLVDVGTGPGLPGFLFVCMKESPKVTLLDGSKRKLGLTEEWWKGLQTKYPEKDCKFQYTRAEEWKNHFDLVVMRAAIPYPFSVEIVSRLVLKDGYFCPFLGKEQKWELIEKRILSESGFTIEGSIDLEDLSFLGERHIKVLKKHSQAKHGIPREWKIISKEIKEQEWEKSSQSAIKKAE